MFNGSGQVLRRIEPQALGIDPAGLNAQIRPLLPGYMTMGQNGMSGMAEMAMPTPDNSIPMRGVPGPHDYIDMGNVHRLEGARRHRQLRRPRLVPESGGHGGAVGRRCGTGGGWNRIAAIARIVRNGGKGTAHRRATRTVCSATKRRLAVGADPRESQAVQASRKEGTGHGPRWPQR